MPCLKLEFLLIHQHMHMFSKHRLHRLEIRESGLREGFEVTGRVPYNRPLDIRREIGCVAEGETGGYCNDQWRHGILFRG
jgi:hypothetical protein